MTTALKNIDKNIKRVATSGDKLNALIHETAMMILHHAAPKDAGGEGHGDCSRAQHLVMAMPASMRRTMLIAWFTKYSPIVTKNSDNWDAKMHKKETASGAENSLYRPFDLEGADAEPFWEMANKQQEREALDFEGLVKMVENLGKRIEKMIDENNVKEEDVESAKLVARTVSGLRFNRLSVVESANDANGDTPADETEQGREAA